MYHVYLYQGGTRVPESQDRKLFPPGTDLLPEGHPAGPRVQGAVRLRVQGIP